MQETPIQRTIFLWQLKVELEPESRVPVFGSLLCGIQQSLTPIVLSSNFCVLYCEQNLDNEYIKGLFSRVLAFVSIQFRSILLSFLAQYIFYRRLFSLKSSDQAQGQIIKDVLVIWRCQQEGRRGHHCLCGCYSIFAWRQLRCNKDRAGND